MDDLSGTQQLIGLGMLFLFLLLAVWLEGRGR